eukprot:TRINITY_DN1716_c0_g1_i1.p1 TRINITY_DN1716_c0_g1~~TRINITY_DN1716_c0_g1_i1.p1  ORF type:complete len:103 (-),score=27.31 TRINITY_DN1716_c0_g1_i1:138-446(-)
MKDGKTVEQRVLSQTAVTKFGRDIAESDVELAHPSCSKAHAKIKFVSKRDGDTPIPSIVDLNSTNGTFLNGKRVGAGEYHPLSHGDRLTFAASTRQYHLHLR